MKNNIGTTFRYLIVFVFIIFLSACGSGDKKPPTTASVNPQQSAKVLFSVKSPEQFTSPFCVKVEVSGEDFETISTNRTYPAKTQVIETLIPNIPVGQGRLVSMGVFSSGKCGPISEAQWMGSVDNVVIQNSEVTIAALDLVRTKVPNVGSVVVRGNQVLEEIRFHAEVVDKNSQPIANANCVVLENNNSIAQQSSGSGTQDLGIIDTDVKVDINTNELLVNCTHPDYRNTSKVAQRITDPNNASTSTFISTVIMADLFNPPQTTELVLIESSNSLMSASLRFAKAKISTQNIAGVKYSSVNIAGAQSDVGVPGSPAIPVMHKLVAIPMGAEVDLLVTLGKERNQTVNLIPFQTEPVDAIEDEIPSATVFANKPFVKNEKEYATNAFFPAKPCTVTQLGEARDLRIAQLSCAAGQYNPVTQELKLFDTIDVEVKFLGGTGNFITERSLSPFETSNNAIIGSVVNAEVVGQFVGGAQYRPICFGEELLILTHPDFRAAADTLATWKKDKGITTHVFNVNDGAGIGPDTNDEIDDFIENRYKNCVVRPSYVLLMGDAEFIPTFYAKTSGSDTTGSDYQYALYPQGFLDIFPDFGVGRIPVDTLAQATTVVDKIVNYESSPPFQGFFNAPFYQNASLASQFQCCRMNADGSPMSGQPGIAQRTFTEVSEFAFDVLNGAGYTAERIYEETVDGGGYCLQKDPTGGCILEQQPYNGDTTPRRYFDNTLVPAAIGPTSGFAWDGSTNGIINAFDDGRFLIIHRDHGWEHGWGTPRFTSNNVSFDLNNGELLPVVYSVNCASALFDNETAAGDYGTSVNQSYFAERLLRKANGGAVGILGDTRNSPSWPNTALTKGFLDATWPTALGFGSNISQRRLGDILNHGKMFLATQIGVAGSGVDLNSVISEYFMWHVIGDPTLEMWTSNPYTLVLPLGYELLMKENSLEVIYTTEGATITAFQETAEGIIPIGRAKVSNGVANLNFVQQPQSDLPIMVSASLNNAVSVLLTKRSNLPDLKLDLQLGTLSLTPGQDISSLLTVTVENVGGGNAQGTILPDGTIQTGGYMIDLVLSSDSSMPFGTASVPLPAGVAYVDDGLLQGGRVSRTPDVPGLSAMTLSNAPPVNSDIGGIIPLQAPTGSQYLCGRVDAGDNITELDEANNVFCLPVRIIAL